MAEKSSRRIFWIVVGAVLSGFVSLAFALYIYPKFLPKPVISFTLAYDHREELGGYFEIENIGNDSANNLVVLIRPMGRFPNTGVAQAVFPMTLSINGDCEVEGGEIPWNYKDPNTPDGYVLSEVAILIECNALHPSETVGGVMQAITEDFEPIAGAHATITYDDHRSEQIATLE